MQSLRLLRWSGSILSPHTRPCRFTPLYRHRVQIPPHLTRLQSYSAATLQAAEEHVEEGDESGSTEEIENYPTNFSSATEEALRRLPSPPPSRAQSSSRLSALHGRLLLPPRLPLETLARCLVDCSADANANFNNASLSILGYDLLGLYTSEYILCHYPRLPNEVLFAAMSAYVGSKTLAAITREWGVEIAAAPGGEVDPGYLQCVRQEPGNASVDGTGLQFKELPKVAKDLSVRPNPELQQQRGWRRGASSKTMYDDYFGDEIKRVEQDYAKRPELDNENADRQAARGVTVEQASTAFVRALMGAIYLHAGRKAAYNFVKAHILSRHLNVSKLFEFRQPTRDLSKLCAREGFESPVARIISETGRKSRTPVFVVGVFAGKDKLGEGAGGSLDEARIRAAISALKGWYLYSPLKVRVPSQAQTGQAWEPVLIDGGEVVV
ncbi:54S ribosomal protein L3 mitochondrial [Lecanora helva]